MTLTDPIEVRLKAKLVESPSGCLEWTGLKNKKRAGYGTIMLHSKNVLTHRLAWELVNGEIPKGLCVLHSCDNPSCCNVEHLWLGTRADNMADKVAKGRQSRYNALKTHCPQGHEYNEENTYHYGSKRKCKICSQAQGARWHGRNKTSI